MTDAIGQEIKIGDIVSHSSGGRTGSTNSIGVVVKLSAKNVATLSPYRFLNIQFYSLPELMLKHSPSCSIPQANIIVITKQFEHSMQHDEAFKDKWAEIYNNYKRFLDA